MTYQSQRQTFLTKINKKEYLIICILLILLLGVGGYTYDKVSSETHAKAQLYLTAIQAVTADQFNYAVDSKQGNVLTTGVFKAVEPITHDELKGGYYRVKKIYQEYRMHTYTYPCGTAESPQICTGTYWSWDRVNSDTETAKELSLHSRKYPSSLFSYEESRRVSCDVITVECRKKYVYTSSDKRHYYNVTDTTFTGTIAVNTLSALRPMEGSGKILIKSQSMQSLVDEHQSKKTLITFIVSYLIAAVAIWFSVIHWFKEIDI